MKYGSKEARQRYENAVPVSDRAEYVVIYDNMEKWACEDREKFLRICYHCPLKTCVVVTHLVVNHFGDIDDAHLAFDK